MVPPAFSNRGTALAVLFWLHYGPCSEYDWSSVEGHDLRPMHAQEVILNIRLFFMYFSTMCTMNSINTFVKKLFE